MLRIYKENDYLDKKDVCKVREVRKNKMNGKDYCILVLINDKSLIKKISSIDTLEFIDDKYIEKIYEELLYIVESTPEPMPEPTPKQTSKPTPKSEIIFDSSIEYEPTPEIEPPIVFEPTPEVE